MNSRKTAILLALLVTFLWSSSWILIKFGLTDIPPLAFAGLRYAIAFIGLLLVGAFTGRLHRLRHLDRSDWIPLAAYGLIFITLTQGAQFLALSMLPAVSVSLVLSFTPLLVALLGWRLLNEAPTHRQLLGIGIFLGGIALYFYPYTGLGQSAPGLLVAGFGLLVNAFSALLGRHLNQRHTLDAYSVTLISMGFGSLTLLGISLPFSGFPSLSPLNWGALLWLGLINSALAFTLWNLALRSLSALESNLINNTMLIQIALLAFLFLGETVTLLQFIGIALVASGILVAQLKKRTA
jgi:drug/metabolite transporter (DMT)-like permease